MNYSHDDIVDLLGAYALDAVDPEEAAAVEEHLAGCPRCTAEVAEHREVAAMLAHTGAPAPDGLWSRIAESLEEPPPELSIPLVAPEADATVIDLAERRRSPLVRWLPVGAAAAVVLVVVGLVAGLVVADDDGGGPDRSEEVALPLLEDVARRVLNDPDAVKVNLTSPDGELAAPAAIDDDGSGYLLGSALPALDESQTYQLWGVSDSVVVSLGVLGASPEVVAFHVGDDVRSLVITQEVAGGVPSSSNPPFLAGDIS